VKQPGWGASYSQLINAIRRGVGTQPVQVVAALTARSHAAAECITKTGQTTDLHNLSKSAACAHAVSWPTANRGASESLITTSSVVGSPRLEMMTFGAAPFHSLALADPRQTQMGFGAFAGSSPSPSTHFTVAVNVTGGHYTAHGTATPVMAWPPAGWSVPGTTSAGAEWPDPLSACGWSKGGSAIWFARPGEATATSAQDLVLKDSTGRQVSVHWCRVTNHSSFADVQETSVAHSWLNEMNAEILIPSVALKGHYILGARVNGHSVTLPFTAS
jgi:hypothetical protein